MLANTYVYGHSQVAHVVDAYVVTFYQRHNQGVLIEEGQGDMALPLFNGQF